MDTTVARHAQEDLIPVPDNIPAAGDRPMLVGQSAAIEEVRAAVGLVAESSTAVLITGESGTGKDVVARLIHERSPRRNQPFVALNCAALPRDVIENELFGHEQGAFTGALKRKIGCFEMAQGGSLFFDEIAEMHVDTQAKLLRAIENKSFRRLGGRDEVNVDVRPLAATNKEIAQALRSKELREDLYYRFSVIEILLPPLRERHEDIPLLIAHFLGEFTARYGKPGLAFSDEALGFLVAYPWPGNVRELKNAIERSVIIARDDVLGPDLLPPKITSHERRTRSITIPVGTSLEEVEKKVIEITLAAVGHNKTEAAKVLKLSRRGLQKKLQRNNR